MLKLLCSSQGVVVYRAIYTLDSAAASSIISRTREIINFKSSPIAHLVKSK